MLLAAGPPEELSRARRMVDVELRYGAAIELLDRVLQDPDLAPKERVEAYRLLGIAYAAKGKSDSAEAAFAALLELEPAFVLDPLLSPKIHAAFEQAKAKVVALPRLEDVRALPEDRRVIVSARLEDPRGRVQVVLLFSRFGDREWEIAEMARSGDRAQAILLLPLLDRLRVEYWLEARDAAGDPVAQAGSREAPSSIVLERSAPEIAPPPPAIAPPTEQTPWYAEWWVWAIAIGVVAAGVGTAVAIDRAIDDDGPEGTLDPIRLD